MNLIDLYKIIEEKTKQFTSEPFSSKNQSVRIYPFPPLRLPIDKFDSFKNEWQKCVGEAPVYFKYHAGVKILVEVELIK